MGVTVVTILTRGVAWGTSNHSLHLPMIRHLIDPETYPGDLLFEHLQGYSTCFHAAFAGLGLADMGLFVAFVVLAPLCALACFALLALLTRHAGGDVMTTFIACLGLGLGYNPSVGQSPFDLELTPALPGFVGGLCALWLFRRRRPVLAFVVAGLTVNIHALYGAFVLLVLGIARFVESPFDWKGHARGAAVGLAAALPILLVYSPATAGPSTLDAWLTIQHIRSPHHIFPSAIGMLNWLNFVTFLLLVARPWRKPEDRRAFDSVFTAALFVSAAAVGVAIMLADFHPIPAVLKLQPLRASVWLYLTALPWWAISIAEGLRQKCPAGAMMTASLFATSFLPSKSLGVLAFVGVAALTVTRWVRLRRFRPLAQWAYFAGLVVAACAGPLLAVVGVPVPFWVPRSPVALVPLVASVLVFAASLRQEAERIPGARLAIVAVVTFTTLAGLSERGGSLMRRGDPAWRQLQDWARVSTSFDSVFVIPAYTEGFRIGSWRTQYADWKDGTHGLFNYDYALKWWRRMGELGIQFDPLREPERARTAFRRLNEARVCEIASRDRLDYLITEDVSQAPSFPLVHQEPPYVVRRIECREE